jgi:hypothetical protein
MCWAELGGLCHQSRDTSLAAPSPKILSLTCPSNLGRIGPQSTTCGENSTVGCSPTPLHAKLRDRGLAEILMGKDWR